ncbi:hypothetical protein EDB80DRAFT_369777 [Ilyonectria destructans]|nr:hypothetical protein EDB80DRAFT_369777 [Ilyonectria destructans]
MGRSVWSGLVWSGLIDMCNALRGGVTRDNMQCKDILIWQPQASKMIDVRCQASNLQPPKSPFPTSPPGLVHSSRRVRSLSQTDVFSVWPPDRTQPHAGSAEDRASHPHRGGGR